jgi:D-alanine-D-alanine ligase
LRIVVLYNSDERLVSGEYGEALAELSLKEEIDVVEGSLRNLGYEFRTIAIQNDTPVLAVANIISGLQPDCVFNLVEAIRGDYSLEMNIPALLDLMKVPYTGSNALTLGLCQDKAKSKAVLRMGGFLTPTFQVFDDKREEIRWPWYWPAIVKPLHEDGSLGITKDSVVKNDTDLRVAVKKIHLGYCQPAIVEEYIDGREFGIGVINFNGGPQAFPASEIVFDGYPEGTPRIVSYDAKWRGDSVEYKNSLPHCPADVDPRLEQRMRAIGLKVFELFGCRGYGRVDLRVKDNFIYVIEVNPNSDIAPGSGIHTVLKAAGVDYPTFVKNIIEGALRGR